MTNLRSKIETTNSLAALFNSSIENICIWIICETEGNDVEHLKKQDHHILISYALHIQHFLYSVGLTPMLFSRWYWSDQDDIKSYQAEQENIFS